MKTKIYNWLLNKLKPVYTKEQKKKINQFKSMFKIFFEGGYDFDAIYETPISINIFGITDFKFNFTDILEVVIVLQRPGMLIGRSGKIINALNDYLKESGIKVSNMEDSKLWNRVN